MRGYEQLRGLWRRGKHSNSGHGNVPCAAFAVPQSHSATSPGPPAQYQRFGLKIIASAAHSERGKVAICPGYVRHSSDKHKGY